MQQFGGEKRRFGGVEKAIPWPIGRLGQDDESTGKPGSVVDNHSSGTCVATGLERPTRIRCEQHQRIPIWPCSRWGLPSHGMLPPMRCALTAPFHPYRFYASLAAHCASTLHAKRRYLSVALSVGSRLPGVTWHLALWSPDFPPSQSEDCYSGCLVDSRQG